MRNRGLTPVVGFTLLVGITAIGAMSLFAVGMSLADATQSSAEQEKLEQSMAQFADSANAVALGEESNKFDISGTSDGSAAVNPGAGHVEMWVESEDGTQTLLDTNLGSYSYQTGDGVEVAYQGGGVWTAGQNGDSTMVKSPPFDYRNEDDPTLTYEMVRILDSDSESNPTAGKIHHESTNDVYPTAGDTNPLQNGTVYIELKSSYCDGWADFFEGRTDSAVQESCSEEESTELDELRVRFDVPFSFDGLDNEPVLATSISDKHGAFQYHSEHGYNSAKVGEHSTASASNLIDSKIESCQGGDEDCNDLSTEVDSAGTYYSEDVDGGDYTFDTENGEIEVVVNGDFNANSVEIDGDNPVTLFVRGDVMTDPGVNYNSNNDADQFRILVHSDGYQVGCFKGQGCGAGGGGSNIHAFVYAPNSNVYIGPGNTHYKGGIIADEIHAHSSSANFNPDNDVMDIEFKYESGGEPFYYLHTSETVVSIGED